MSNTKKEIKGKKIEKKEIIRMVKEIEEYEISDKEKLELTKILLKTLVMKLKSNFPGYFVVDEDFESSLPSFFSEGSEKEMDKAAEKGEEGSKEG